MIAAFFDTLVNAFTMPAINDTVVVTVNDVTQYAAGMWIYIVGIGYLEVTSVGATDISVKNIGNSGSATAGTTVVAGTAMIPGFPKPEADVPLQPVDKLTASFVTVANAASVNITIQDNTWVAAGMTLFILGAGKLLVIAVNADGVTVTVQNGKTLNTRNTGAGTTIALGTAVFACDNFLYTT